jgi:integrase
MTDLLALSPIAPDLIPDLIPDQVIASQPRLDQHPAAVYLARLAPGSRRTMRQALNTMADLLSGGRADSYSFPWQALRYQHTTALRARLAEKYSAATANKMLAALRGALQEAWRLGQMSAEDYRRAVDLAPVRSNTLLRGRALAAGEIRAIFRECAKDQRATGRRDAALLAVLYGCGLRRAEVVALSLEHYNPVDCSLTILVAKGNRERLVYLPTGAQQALEAWLRVRGRDSGPLFLPVNKGGRILQARMADHAVRKILGRRARAAGVVAFSPHDLRRTFISDLLDAGADIVNVQHLAGHANVQTTARYDRRGEAAKKRTASLLHIPFKEMA